jgi:hypothetical protein
VLKAKYLPIQKAMEIKASQCEEDEAEDDDLQTTPEYLHAKWPIVINLTT